MGRENANQEFEDVADRTIASKSERQLVEYDYRAIALMVAPELLQLLQL